MSDSKQSDAVDYDTEIWPSDGPGVDSLCFIVRIMSSCSSLRILISSVEFLPRVLPT